MEVLEVMEAMEVMEDMAIVDTIMADLITVTITVIITAAIIMAMEMDLAMDWDEDFLVFLVKKKYLNICYVMLCFLMCNKLLKISDF